MSQQTLVAVEFHGHTLTLIDHDGQPYVAMRPVVEAIGLSWSGQFERIKRHPVLGPSVVMTTTVEPGTVRVTRTEMVSLPLNRLEGWLFGIDASRVKPELRDTLIAYQSECFDVLHRHWHGATPEAPETPSAFPRRGEADAVVDANRMFSAYLRTGSALKLPLHRLAPIANERVRQRAGIDLFEDLGVTEADLLPAALAGPEAPLDAWAESLDTYLADRQTVRAQDAANHLRGRVASNADVVRVTGLLKARGWSCKTERIAGNRCGQARVWRRAEVVS